MKTTKLTVRIPKNLLEQAKQFAQENDTTLTRLVSTYFSRLTVENDPLADAPLVRSLIGTLPEDIDASEYHHYLEEKYGRPN